MVTKYIAVEEETTFGSNVGGTPIYLKGLSESVNTEREDYEPETFDLWTVHEDNVVDGHKTGGGDFEIPVDALRFPLLIAMHVGDPVSSVSLSAEAYFHQFKFGANEQMYTSGVKPLTYFKGVGVEKDRQFNGCVIENMAIQANNGEPVTAVFTIKTMGYEKLITAKTPNYGGYSGGIYYAYHHTNTFTIGGADRRNTAPTVENFSVNFRRGFDWDHRTLSSPYVANPVLHGKALVEGEMDLTFTSEDEHERFLGIVGGDETGIQSSFGIIAKFRQKAIGDTGQYYDLQIDIPAARWKASEANIVGADRIVQKMNLKGFYDTTEACAAKFTVISDVTSSFITLSDLA